METNEFDEQVENALDVVQAAGFRITDPAHIAALHAVYTKFTDIIDITMLNEELRIQLDMVQELIFNPNHAI